MLTKDIKLEKITVPIEFQIYSKLINKIINSNTFIFNKIIIIYKLNKISDLEIIIQEIKDILDYFLFKNIYCYKINDNELEYLFPLVQHISGLSFSSETIGLMNYIKDMKYLRHISISVDESIELPENLRFVSLCTKVHHFLIKKLENLNKLKCFHPNSEPFLEMLELNQCENMDNSSLEKCINLKELCIFENNNISIIPKV